MIVELWLKKTEDTLRQSGIGTARLDALVLLEDTTGKDRVYLLAHPEFVLHEITVQKLEKQVNKRKKHVPLAQIRGKTEFYGREFTINKHVLEPRPESETMIDLLKSLKLPTNPVVVDIGTGSGAIGITVALEIPKSKVTLTDIDPKCLEAARQNTVKHAVDVEIMQADLLTNVPKVDVIVANLPYVPDSYEINRAALNEPKIAIFGGPDGLDLYRKLFEQIAHLKEKPLFVLTESLPFQHKKLAQIAAKSGYKKLKEEDFIQFFTALST
jgi:release factor glutamine methyltransferase